MRIWSIIWAISTLTSFIATLCGERHMLIAAAFSGILLISCLAESNQEDEQEDEQEG